MVNDRLEAIFSIVRAIEEGLQVEPDTVIIPFSAETKQGREEIWNLIDSWLVPAEEV